MVKLSLQLVLQSYFDHVCIEPKTQDTYQAQIGPEILSNLSPEFNPICPA